jgi:cell division transport system ATP-binding protein
LIGGSGSGKTSLIKALIGEIPLKSGKIFDDAGMEVSALSGKGLAKFRRSVGVVFQDYKLLPSKTVRENVAFAMEVCGYSDSKILARVPEVLSQVGILSKKEAFIDALSGGEAQRVAVARALIHDPSVIIGDEPTGNLDPENAMEIMRILAALAENGKTVIVATHDEKIVDRMKKRVVTLKEGRVVSDIRASGYAPTNHA